MSTCERCEKHTPAICLECAGEDAAEIERLEAILKKYGICPVCSGRTYMDACSRVRRCVCEEQTK